MSREVNLDAVLKSANAIYLATDQAVARDIAKQLMDCAKEIREDRAEIAKLRGLLDDADELLMHLSLDMEHPRPKMPDHLMDPMEDPCEDDPCDLCRTEALLSKIAALGDGK